MIVLETDRLVLRRLTLDDAEFIFELVNEPSFIENIGDKGVRSLDDAREYLGIGPLESYQRFGFGLFLVLLKDGQVPIGMCGLLQRETLEHPDVGFAFKPDFWRKGYASESAAAVLEYGRTELGMEQIVAVTSPDNAGSAAVLEKIGLRFDRMVDFNGAPNRLFVQPDPGTQ